MKPVDQERISSGVEVVLGYAARGVPMITFKPDASQDDNEEDNDENDA